MFQSAVNLHLVSHTLDHASFVHRFFVNLQTKKEDYTPATRMTNMQYGTGLLVVWWVTVNLLLIRALLLRD